MVWGGIALDNFTCSMMGMVYFLGVILVAVFGPTFIDRSISYHIAFYAVDEGAIDIEKMENAFADEIFEKRIHDAVETGVIVENKNGEYEPSWKAKTVTYILKPIGNLTNSLETYVNMKNIMDMEETAK